MKNRRFANSIRLAIIGVAGPLLILAQTQVGTVTSSAPFQLRGATISPGEGVPSWPVLPGDTLSAGDAPTIVTFTDGSVVSMEPHAAANASLSGNTPGFQLIKGKASYSLKSPTSLKLLVGNHAVTTAALSGTITGVPLAVAGSAFLTPTALAAVGGAGAAATGVAVGVEKANSSGGQISPSR
jgi:hypothetical protein